MAVSENRGTPKSSILIGFSIIFTIYFEGPSYFWISTHMNWMTFVGIFRLRAFGSSLQHVIDLFVVFKGVGKTSAKNAKKTHYLKFQLEF